MRDEDDYDSIAHGGGSELGPQASAGLGGPTQGGGQVISPMSGIRALLRVTHEPTGESVTFHVPNKESLRQAKQAAIRVLRARLAAPHGPERLVRSYEADEQGRVEDPLNPGEWLA